jgi:hypothetical protein
MMMMMILVVMHLGEIEEGLNLLMNMGVRVS